MTALIVEPSTSVSHMIFFTSRGTSTEDLPSAFEAALEERALKFDLGGACVTVGTKTLGTCLSVRSLMPFKFGWFGEHLFNWDIQRMDLS